MKFFDDYINRNFTYDQDRIELALNVKGQPTKVTKRGDIVVCLDGIYLITGDVTEGKAHVEHFLVNVEIIKTQKEILYRLPWA